MKVNIKLVSFDILFFLSKVSFLSSTPTFSIVYMLCVKLELNYEFIISLNYKESADFVPYLIVIL